MSNFKNNGADKGHGPKVCNRAEWDALPFSDKCHYEEYELRQEDSAVFQYYAKGKNKHAVVSLHHRRKHPKARVRKVIFI